MKRRDFIRTAASAAAVMAAPAAGVASGDYLDNSPGDRVFILDGQRYLVEQRRGVFRLVSDSPLPLLRKRLTAAYKVAGDIATELREAAMDEFMLGKSEDETEWSMTLHISRELGEALTGDMLTSWRCTPSTPLAHEFGLRVFAHEPTPDYWNMVEFRFAPSTLGLTGQLAALERDFFN